MSNETKQPEVDEAAVDSAEDAKLEQLENEHAAAVQQAKKVRAEALAAAVEDDDGGANGMFRLEHVETRTTEKVLHLGTTPRRLLGAILRNPTPPPPIGLVRASRRGGVDLSPVFELFLKLLPQLIELLGAAVKGSVVSMAGNPKFGGTPDEAVPEPEPPAPPKG